MNSKSDNTQSTLCIPRPEYPRPQFVRSQWQNLNGEWEFEIDLNCSGRERSLNLCSKLKDKIIVPFCPESKLSGIGYTDFMPSVWYAKSITVTKEQLDGNVIVNFGAADYITQVYINGTLAGTHEGGYTSFSFNITEHLRIGENRITVECRDDLRNNKQACGKQSRELLSHHCDYTRTTGIWQTVWLEFTPKTYIQNVKITATDLNGLVHLQTKLNEYKAGLKLIANISFNGKNITEQSFDLSGVVTEQAITVPHPEIWDTSAPNLYDINFTLIDGKDIVDSVQSYFGIRRIDIDGKAVRINDKSVFQRLILDQGFYPDGIITAPSDAALVRDIELSKSLGFNGARLHQKVFEERFLYHADKMGYFVWGEFASWGADISDPMTLHSYLPQWIESVNRDYNHPSIIGWCPHNETWDFELRAQINSNISVIFNVTKAIDATRPVIDTSGNYHTGATDIYDAHLYCQDVEEWNKKSASHDQTDGKIGFECYPERQSYGGQPYFLSEYGGIKWNEKSGLISDMRSSWGYGDAPKSMEEFTARYVGLTETLLNTKNMMGFCYTQLTDVEQEQNGLYYYDRAEKFPKELYDRMKAANKKIAAIEKIDG